MTLGQNIARLRAQKNLSQGDLADALEVSRQSVSKWETDASIPELDKLLRLAELFGVTLDELVKGESAQPETARGEVPDKESAGAYTAAAPAARRETRQIVGTILLCFGALIGILIMLFAGTLAGFILALPLFVCGTICLTVRQRTGLWCAWALYIGFAALSCKLYKAADEKKRAQLRGLFAVLLLADEAFKQIGLQIGGNFNWDYLPLHLCSINIFLIALHAWKPSRLLDNFLYFICIPAATAALLFPTWTSLPAANFMFWHSTSVHILLAAYPIMLFSGGDIRPSVRYMGKCFLLLLAMAVPIYCVNLLLDTNFMFLMYAPDGNPLAWFRDHVGYHWIGFPVLLLAVFALMDVPIMLKKRKEDKLLSAVKRSGSRI